MTLALDISNFTAERTGPLTKNQIEDAYNLGVRAFRPNIEVQEYAVQQIDAIVDSHVPMDIWTYRWYSFIGAIQQAEEDKNFIQRVRELKYNIQLHSIDIEDTNPNISIPERILISHSIIGQFTGFCPTDLYTGQWYWEQYMGNTTELNYMPLWFARYPNNQLPDTTLTPYFGGWTKGHMHQYIGNIIFAGIWCDVNYYEEPQPLPPVEEPTLIKVSANKLYRFELE